MDGQEISFGLTEIEKSTNNQLKDLVHCTSDQKYDEIVDKTDRVKTLQSEREILLASISSLAEFNLAKQSDYESDRSILLSLVSDCNKLKEEIQERAAKLSELSRKTSLESTLAVVLTATNQAEQESEKVASSFLDSNLDYESFLAEYLNKRKVAHSRRIKADKLRHENKETWTTGIADSEGVIYDFGGSHYIAVDNMTFGKPTKYLKLEPSKVESREWDDAIQVSNEKFRRRTHNLIMNNCHDHVADALNEMKYDGRSDYNSFDVFLMMTFRSQYVGFGGFLRQWALFGLLLLTIVIVCVFGSS